MLASKYHAIIDRVAKLETDAEAVLVDRELPNERSRLIKNIRYHLKPPKGYAFASKYIYPHIYIFLKRL